MAEFEGGTLYDANKQFMMKEVPLTQKKVKELIDTVVVDYFKKGHSVYFMLLCHERRDYTLFNFLGLGENTYTLGGNELKECLDNRGKILDIRVNEDNVVEIWIKCDDDAFAYFLFPYDEGVIEVED